MVVNLVIINLVIVNLVIVNLVIVHLVLINLKKDLITVRRFFYAITSTDNMDSNYPNLSTLGTNANITLTESIYHHWCKVLRANLADKGILFDGFGGEYVVQLNKIDKKQATATLLAYDKEDRSAPFISKIGLVMSRGDRMDYAIQKATELGVTAIQLLSSHHSEVKLKPTQVDKKLAHWQQVAIAACEQCGLNRPPLILAPLPIDHWLSSMAQDTDPVANPYFAVSPVVKTLSQDAYYQRLYDTPAIRLMMSVPKDGQPMQPISLDDVLNQDMPYIELLIGPEGGLSPDESKCAEEAGFEPWQIGSRVLRTETAPVVALATLNAIAP